MVKKFQIIKTREKLYGFCNEKGDVHINIQLIWETYPSVNRFIKHFSKNLLHEQLHGIIDDIVIGKVYHDKVITQKNYRLGVERVIRRLTKQSWNSRDKEDYLK